MAKVNERLISIKDLQKLGISITPGNEFIPKKRLPKKVPSIEKVRQRLSKIKGSLAETIAQMRETEE